MAVSCTLYEVLLANPPMSSSRTNLSPLRAEVGSIGTFTF